MPLLKKSRQEGFTYFAFHPAFEHNGKFYTVHSEPKCECPVEFPLRKPVPDKHGVIMASSHHEAITEWTAKDPTKDEFAGTRRELLRVEQPYDGHNVGQIAFDPNAMPGDSDFGYLFIAIGDGGTDGFPNTPFDPMHGAQDLTSPLGSLLRIDPEGNNSANGRYGVPEDNPFFDAIDPNTVREIWAYGLRNPHRIIWDESAEGTMLISDIGLTLVEEVNIGVAGGNYGWSLREGHLRTNRDNQNEGLPLPEDDKSLGFVYPAAFYTHADGNGAIGGGVPYRGQKIPGLIGHFLFADFTAKDIWYHVPIDTLKPGGSPVLYQLQLRDPADISKTQPFAAIIGQPGSRTDVRFGVDRDGEILVLSKQDGWIRKLIPAASD